MSANAVYVLVINTPGISGPIQVGAVVDGSYRNMPASADGFPFDLSVTLAGGREVRTGCFYTHSTGTFTRGTLEPGFTALDLVAGARVAVTAAASSLPTRAETLALRAMASGVIGVGSPILIASDTREYLRNSANTAADSEIGSAVTSFVLPGGLMGARGKLRFELRAAHSGSAVNKRIALYIGATQFGVEWNITTTQTTSHGLIEVYNTALAAQKWAGSIASYGSGTAGWVTSAVNTGVDQTVNVHLRFGGAANAEFIRLHAFDAVVYPG